MSKAKGVTTNPFEAIGNEVKALAESPSGDVAPPPAPPAPAGPKAKGGKKGHPDYQQATAYVRKETYVKVKAALLTRHGQKEFSELVAELLDKWLADQAG